LVQQIQNVLPCPRDHHLETYFIIEWLKSQNLHSISNPDPLVSDALEHFKEFDDPDLKCMLSYDCLSVETNLSSHRQILSCLSSLLSEKG
jgi:hypothetical protein